MAHPELGVAHGLLNQVFTGPDQVRQPAPVGPFGNCLVLDPPPDLGLIQLVGRKGSQLLVGLRELQFPVAHFQRLAMPLAELFGKPDRVLLGAQHIEQIRGRVDPPAAGEVIFREDPDIHRLRLDAQRLRRECAGDLERFLVIAPSRQDALAFCRCLDDGTLHSLPFHADPLDAEIVLSLDLELQSFRIEHDLLAGQVFTGHRGGLIVAAVDRQQEGRCARQAELILPAELHGSCSIDPGRLAGDLGSLRPPLLTVHFRCLQVAAGDGGKAGRGPLDERDGPAPHVFLLGAVAAQVVGKRDVGDDRGQFGTQHRLDPDSLR